MRLEALLFSSRLEENILHIISDGRRLCIDVDVKEEHSLQLNDFTQSELLKNQSNFLLDFALRT